jgi:lysophospholipase L1-like esterase
MKLSTDEIRSVSIGAVDFLVEEDGITPFRLTAEQRELYKNISKSFWMKSHSSAGICLSFETDSKTLGLTLELINSNNRSYFSADLLVNGEYLDSLSNIEGTDFPEQYAEASFPNSLGIREKTFSLGDGKKEVRLYLPWSKCTKIRSLTLDDGAFVKPVKPEKKILFFGDSITEGFDSLYTKDRWTARIAHLAGAEEINKAIGGEQYCPYLSATKDSFTPDYIIVAYGTNSWKKRTPEEFYRLALDFYENLERNYPGVPVFALSPIWRKSHDIPIRIPLFSQMHDMIREAIKKWDNITLINGWNLVPHELSFFADAGLHPNPAGIDCFTNKLWEKIQNLV